MDADASRAVNRTRPDVRPLPEPNPWNRIFRLATFVASKLRPKASKFTRCGWMGSPSRRSQIRLNEADLDALAVVTPCFHRKEGVNGSSPLEGLVFFWCG